jgi:tripartite-type tricarboxylate transporter receptor subunit TctC
VPDLPSIATQGVPGYSFELWWAVMAPPKLPHEIVAKLNADINRILETPDMKEVFLREGAEPAPMSSEQFAQTVKSEIEGWKRVAQRANIKLE